MYYKKSIITMFGISMLMNACQKNNMDSDIIRSTDVTQYRKLQYPIDKIFINRWSPRAMSGESMSNDELFRLFEAARWAPSSFNEQPWRFIYAHRETPEWNILYNLLVPFNQQWVKNAGALIIIISKNSFTKNNEPNITHSFDTGAAWAYLALQGSLQGLVVHGMSGFDYNKAKKDLDIPDDYTIEAMVAVGKPAAIERLPEEMRSYEKPSSRNMQDKFVFEGSFSR